MAKRTNRDKDVAEALPAPRPRTRLSGYYLWIVALAAAAVVAAGLYWATRERPAPRGAEAVAPSRGEYIDAVACAGCHAEIAATYAATGMARAFHRATPQLMAGVVGSTYYHETSGRFYEIAERGGRYYQLRYQVENSARINVYEKEIHYVMGSGNHARTYLHHAPSGKLVQLPLGWYAENGGFLAMNPGYDQPRHRGFQREISSDCMFCHNGYAEVEEGSDSQRVDPRYPRRLPQGIDCQRCHGPGREHVERAAAGDSEAEVRAAILNPARLTPERQLEVCMQCHLETTSRRLPYAVRRFGRGAFSYRPGEPLSDYILHFDHAPGSGREDRFEIAHAAYRLRKSACFVETSGSPRAMTCTTCHDPHSAPRGASAGVVLSEACRNCHASIAAPAHPEGQDCASCHMPKRRTDDVVHVVMTDHYIQRRKPSGDLTAPLKEVAEDETNAYRGRVAPYYPERFSDTSDGELYAAVAQVMQTSNLDEGIERLQAAIDRLQPQQAGFYFHLAEAYEQVGRHADAFAMYDAAIAKDPGHVIALRNYGAALSLAGAPEKAQEVLERARAAAPDDSKTLNNLGEALISRGRMTAAVNVLDQAIRLDPDLPQAHRNLAVASASSGQVGAAAAAAREAIRIQPDYAAAHNTLANLLAQWPQAEKHFKEALRLDPGDAETHYNYGTRLAAEERLVEAEHHLRLALSLSPELAPARSNLGNLRASRGAYAEAVEQFRLAIEADPKLAAAHLNLGMALAASGDHAGAAGSFRNTLDLEPDNLVARLNLGMALAQMGDPSSRGELQAVLDDPKAPSQFREAAERALGALAR